MQDCIFCQIAKGEIPSHKVCESDNFIAILDINPNTKGSTLLIPKKHYPSNLTEFSYEVLQSAISAARHVSKILQKSLNVSRVGIAIEGTGVDHFHIKLYPFHSNSQDIELEEAESRKFFDEYPGYLSTQLGPEADFSELQELAKEIQSCVS